VSEGGGEGKRSSLDRVLVLAPYRKDADYLCRLLAEHDIDAAHSVGANDLAELLAESAGVLVATHEALTPDILKIVAMHLQAQPAWSEMPIVVLLDRASPNRRVRAELARSWPRSRQLFYERPVSAVELLSGIQSALLVRVRQRDVGDHINRETELRLELNHRVKNILASVSSIFQMTRRGASSIDELTDDFTGRLTALADVHSAVFRADGETVSIGEIVNLTFAPYSVSGKDRVATRGPNLILTREAGTTLALCLHELTTNAIKYGALSVPAGRVSFQWAVDEDIISVEWKESGGPPVVEPTRAGYGTRYLRSALASLFAQPPVIEFRTGGLFCKASGPARRLVSNS
jgi:two-component sensor histidine kinase